MVRKIFPTLKFANVCLYSNLSLPCLHDQESFCYLAYIAQRLAYIKFMFSKKDTKFDEIFTVDLTFTT